VEVRSAVDPAGRTGILLQLPDLYVVLPPDDARQVAWALIETIADVERAQPPA